MPITPHGLGFRGETLKVEGIADLQRAFRLVDRGLAGDLRAALESAAQPVRFGAEQRARSEITGIRRGVIPWWSMRIGVTRGSVYVAPLQRGVKTRGRQSFRRPNLAPLLMDRAMDPALQANIGKAQQEIADALDDLARRWAAA